MNNDKYLWSVVCNVVYLFPQCAHWAYLWFIVSMKSLFDIVNKDKENLE